MNQYKQLFERLHLESKKLGIVLLDPASDEDIDRLELAVNRRLPEGIKDFYKLCNGFETEDLLFRVIPIKEILEVKNQLNEAQLYFAEYLIYSDSWILEIKSPNEYSILNGNHKSDEPIALTDSILEFLERYLQSDGVTAENGLYKLFEEKKKKNFT